MKNIALMSCLLLLAGCAQTKFYDQGKCIASFQGDMQNQHFSYAGTSTRITWNASTVSHSSATLAQGQAADTVLGGVATNLTAAGIAVATSGAVPGGLGTLFHFH